MAPNKYRRPCSIAPCVVLLISPRVPGLLDPISTVGTISAHTPSAVLRAAPYSFHTAGRIIQPSKAMSLLGSGLLGSNVLCQIPAGTAPQGVRPNFDDPPTYAPAVIAVTAIVLFFATLFTGCRLLANWRKLTWSDRMSPAPRIPTVGSNNPQISTRWP